MPKAQRVRTYLRDKDFLSALKFVTSAPFSDVASQELRCVDHLGQTPLHSILRDSSHVTAASPSSSSSLSAAALSTASPTMPLSVADVSTIHQQQEALHCLLPIITRLAPDLHFARDDKGWLPLHHLAFEGDCMACLRFALAHCRGGVATKTAYGEKTPLQLCELYNRSRPKHAEMRRELEIATKNDQLRTTLLLCIRRMFVGAPPISREAGRLSSIVREWGGRAPAPDDRIVRPLKGGQLPPTRPHARQLLDGGLANELEPQLFAAAVIDMMVCCGWGERAWWIVTCLGERK